MRVKATAPIIIIGFIIILFSFVDISALDSPHNASNNISCGDCHGAALLNSPFWGGSYSPVNIDDTVYNKLCLNCHRTSSGPYTDTNAPLEKTHSSMTTSDKDSDCYKYGINCKYGDWTRECRTCHDPHYQKQKNYKNTDAGNLYLAKGKITSCEYTCPVCPQVVGKTVLTYSTNPPITYKSGWYPPPEDDPNKKYLTKKTSDYRRTILFPNVGKLGYNYPIIAVDTPTANTITVDGNAAAFLCSSQTYECDPPSCCDSCCDQSCPKYPNCDPCPPPQKYSCNLSSPTDFAVIYGQYIKDFIDVSGTLKTVKFFDQAGTKSFADGDTTYNGVCEVCHTQTTHFRNDGSGSDQKHTNVGSGIPGTNCIACHPHIEGFKASCNACHGYPPPSLASIPLPTGSATAGAHVLHVTTKGYQCSICHYNSAGSGATHNNNIITLGFVSLLGAYTGGSYDGQTTANYQSSDAGTTVSKIGNKQCSNIYCHGGTMAPNGGTASAVWDNPSSAACGTCHGASTSSPPMRGSHQKHAGSTLQLPCSDCHNGYTPSTIPSGMATHVNNAANFAFDTSKNYIATASYNGTTTMLDAYGYCSSTHCHGSGGTPQWGAINTNTDCTWCHGGNAASAVPITLVNHPAHMNQEAVLGTNYACAQCHSTTVSAGNDRLITGTVHANGTKDVSMLMGGTWESGAAICSSVYCHSSGKGTYVSPLAWGSPTNFGCNGCHGTSNAIGWPDYANEGAGLTNANSHISHVTTSADCNTCHTNTTTTGTAIKAGSILHTNKALDVNFDTTKAGGSATWTAGTKTCSNISCHCDTNAQWGQTLTCIDCHSGSCGSRAAITSQFSANSHHIQGVPLTGTHCYQCHWEANVDGTINSKYHGGSKAPGSAVDLVIYGNGSRPSDDSGTVIHYVADGSRGEIKNLNTHCLSCHSDQNNDTVPFGDEKKPKDYAWDGTSIDARYSQAGTTAWVRYGGNADVPIINESFEGSGYEEFSQGKKADATLEPDYTPIPGTPPSGVDFGSQCLQSAVVLNHGKQAYATRDLGSEITKTLTSFYLYVENAQEFTGDSYKNIAIFENSGGANNVIIFRLFYIGVNQLQFNLRIYNNGAWRDYYYPATGYISINTWYKIDIKYDNINNIWDWRVDGEIQPDPIFNNALTGTHRDGIQIWDFGFYGTGVSLTGTIYFDLITVEGHIIGNFTPKNTQTKAYSAHGNATANQGGWKDSWADPDEEETWPDKRYGSEDIACFDCHNSHGSNISGTTTSYTSATTNGGILKDIEAGKGGYSWLTSNYKPQAGGSTENKNAYNAGAGLCFDCHLTYDGGTSKPWGYNSAFEATQPIMGYRDTQYFGPGTYSGPQQRFPYKKITPPEPRSMGGHFGASSGGTATSGSTTTIVDTTKNWSSNQWKNNYVIMKTGENAGQNRQISTNTANTLTVLAFAKPVAATDSYVILGSVPIGNIGGLCTPCHDPHGVTDNTDKIAAADKQYAVPLLKGTWLTSFYKEDRAPANNEAGTLCTDKGKEGVQYHIDQNTFGSDIKGTGIYIWETDRQFAGLCLNCHTKTSLTNGANGGTWKSIDRNHESVKGWGANVKHNYTCSKCHAPHNSRLPRLMITNCLDRRLKGRMENNNNPVISGSGNGAPVYPGQLPIICNGKSKELGFCPDVLRTQMPAMKGDGSGNFPGSWEGGWRDYSPSTWPQYANSVTCHEDNAPDQSWNTKTQWYDDRPVITSGPMAGTPTLVVADIQVTITWTTDIASTSYVDYGVTQAYGSTAGNSALVTNHSVTLTGLTNYLTHHYKVRSAGPLGTEVESGDNIFDIDPPFPPLAPLLQAEEDNSCVVTCPVTLDWYEAINPGNGGPVKYKVQVKKQTTAWANSEYDSGWMTEAEAFCDGSTCNWTVTIRPDPDTTWNWRVIARDTDSLLTSEWSLVDSFTVTQPGTPTPPPLEPIIIVEPDIVSPVPVDITLQWEHVAYSYPLDYFVQVNSESDFSGSDPDHNHISDWIPEGTLCVDGICSWTLTLPTDTTWYWRVQAWNANDHGLISAWSTVDSFTIYPLIINESFERNPGYDEAGLWTEINNPDEDYQHSLIPGTPTPPTGAGSQCLQSVSASPGYKAYATRDLGSVQTKTFASFYVYVEAETLPSTGTQKDICTLSESYSGNLDAIILRLRKGTSGNLRFRLSLYNNGGWAGNNYDSTVISKNTWYKIDIKYDNTGSNPTWEWRLGDGITQVTQGSGSLTGTHRTGIQQWVLGFQGSEAYTGTIYFDLIKANTLYYQ